MGTERATLHHNVSAAQHQMMRIERVELAKLCRQRERLAKHAIEAQAATLEADFEKQLDTYYSFNQSAVWEKAHELAQAAVKTANQAVRAESEKLGIPAEFAPRISVGWFGQGQQSSKERKGELRKVAYSRIQALVQDAKFKLEQFSLEIQTKLLAEGLETAAAKAFLESMPTAEQLMPALKLDDIEAQTPKGKYLDDGDDDD